MKILDELKKKLAIEAGFMILWGLAIIGLLVALWELLPESSHIWIALSLMIGIGIRYLYKKKSHWLR